eukprot:3500075-Pleurochrysis_carterae.AAC.2
MSRPLNRSALLRELDCTRVMDVHEGGTKLLAPVSARRPRRYITSAVVCEAATISASVDDSEMQCCRFEP